MDKDTIVVRIKKLLLFDLYHWLNLESDNKKGVCIIKQRIFSMYIPPPTAYNMYKLFNTKAAA
jgi:hypothetical protein